MEVLYHCMKDGIPCSITKEGDSYFCNIDREQNKLDNSFTEEEKHLDFLLDCIIGAYYKKYLSWKELEEIDFD